MLQGKTDIISAVSEPRSYRFARHFRWSLLGQAATMAASFFATPYLVKNLGLDAYGLYLILQSATSYLVLATFGAGSATITQSAAARADGDPARLRQVLRHSLWMHGPAVALAAGVAVLSAEPLLARVFQVPPHLLAAGGRVLAGAMIGGVFFSLTQAATSAMQGLQRFEASNAVGFLQSGLMPVAAVLTVRAGAGVGTVAAAYAAIQVLGAIVAWSWLSRILAEEKNTARRRSEPLAFGTFASLSAAQWMGQLAWIVSYQFDRLFAANRVSLAAMTLYAVPVGLLQRLNVITATFGTVAIPMLGEHRGHDEDLRRLYLRQYRLLLWLGLPGLVLFFSLMPQFLSMWLGGRFGDDSVWPARLQVLAQGFALLSILPGSLTLAQHKPWMQSGLAWTQALLSLGAWAALVPRFGLVGVGWGALLGQALPALIYIPMMHRRVLGLGVRRYLKDALFAPALSAATMLAVVFPYHDRAAGWTGLAGFTAMGLAAYGVAVWLLLGSDDRALVRRYFAPR